MTPPAWASERWGPRATQLRELASGGWSSAYALERDGRPLVLRMSAHDEDFAKDAAMSERSRPGLPIPRVVEWGPAGERWFCLSERAEGRFLDALHEGELRSVLPSLRQMLAELRRVDLRGTEGWGSWDGEGRAPFASWAESLLEVGRERPRLPGWRTALESSVVGAGAFDCGLDLLTRLAPHVEVDRGLVHGDLLNRNVLVRDAELSAIFDWGCSVYGDPLYDVAWLTAFSPLREADLVADVTSRVDLRQRLLVCRLHILLDGLAFSAFAGHPDELRWSDAQLRQLLDAQASSRQA